MFDLELIKGCAEPYPVEFYSLCAIAAIMIPIGAILMISMSMILMEG